VICEYLDKHPSQIHAKIYCAMRKIKSVTSWQPAHYTMLSRVRMKRLWQHDKVVLIKQAFACIQVAIRVLF